jgi:hypothetical protein
VTTAPGPEAGRPALVVVRGDPTAEEVAALVAVLAARAAAPAPAPAPASEWAAAHRRVRAAHRHGPGAWRASGLPR